MHYINTHTCVVVLQRSKVEPLVERGEGYTGSAPSILTTSCESTIVSKQFSFLKTETAIFVRISLWTLFGPTDLQIYPSVSNTQSFLKFFLFYSSHVWT